LGKIPPISSAIEINSEENRIENHKCGVFKDWNRNGERTLGERNRRRKTARKCKRTETLHCIFIFIL